MGQASTQLAHEVASAALPAPALAALPPEVEGTPVPSLAPMLERVTPAVVNIYTKQVVRVRNPIAEFFGGRGFPQQRVQQSLGSGVIVDATRGLILTNNHVIEGADSVSVTASPSWTGVSFPLRKRIFASMESTRPLSATRSSTSYREIEHPKLRASGFQIARR